MSMDTEINILFVMSMDTEINILFVMSMDTEINILFVMSMDTEINGPTPAASVYCVYEQGTQSALP